MLKLPENVLWAVGGESGLSPPNLALSTSRSTRGNEPAETLVALAPAQDVHLVMPRLGEPVELSRTGDVEAWWRSLAAGEAHRAEPEEPPSLPPNTAAVPWVDGLALLRQFWQQQIVTGNCSRLPASINAKRSWRVRETSGLGWQGRSASGPVAFLAAVRPADDRCVGGRRCRPFLRGPGRSRCSGRHSPRLDHDTKDMPRTSDVFSTIIEKIERCAVFVADRAERVSH